MRLFFPIMNVVESLVVTSTLAKIMLQNNWLPGWYMHHPFCGELTCMIDILCQFSRTLSYYKVLLARTLHLRVELNFCTFEWQNQISFLKMFLKTLLKLEHLSVLKGLLGWLEFCRPRCRFVINSQKLTPQKCVSSVPLIFGLPI